jgi:hypothetical protein
MPRFSGKFAKSLFTTGQPRSINNLFTGAGLSRKGKGIALAGIGGYAAYESFHQMNRYNRETALMYNLDPNIYALPQTGGDGMTYDHTYKTHPQDQGQKVTSFDPVGTSGDLVFALHNLRHGG